MTQQFQHYQGSLQGEEGRHRSLLKRLFSLEPLLSTTSVLYVVEGYISVQSEFSWQCTVQDNDRKGRVQYRTGSVQYRTGSVQYRTGSVQYRMDSVQYRMDSVQSRMDSVQYRWTVYSTGQCTIYRTVYSTGESLYSTGQCRVQDGQCTDLV